MTTIDRVHSTATEFKFAREALMDLPTDASQEERQAATDRRDRAFSAHSRAVSDLVQERRERDRRQS